MDSNGYIVPCMVNSESESSDIDTLPLEQNLLHVSKEDLPCGMKSLDAYKTKEDHLQDVELDHASCFTFQLTYNS